MKWNLKKIFLIVFLLCSISAIIYALYFFNTYHEIKYEYIKSYDSPITIDNDTITWFTMRSEEYNGLDFYPKELLDAQNINFDDFDYNTYTYVITVGRKMRKLEYSYSSMINRKHTIFPKQFVGKITLESSLNNKIYIYRIPRMDIDCDYHNPSYNIILE